MKTVLRGADEIVDYISSLDENVDTEFLRDYLLESGGEVRAELRTVSIESLLMAPAENHEASSYKQKKYNAMTSEAPPILIEEDFMVRDGYHRIRSAIFQKKYEIKAYVLIFS